MNEVTYEVRPVLDDAALSALHARAFAVAGAEVTGWSLRLEKQSLTWVAAFDPVEIVGFVNVCWDGGKHALLLDTVVDPRLQGRGIGAELVRIAVAATRAAGCDWLHVDYEPQLAALYPPSLGFRPTSAAVLDLRGDR